MADIIRFPIEDTTPCREPFLEYSFSIDIFSDSSYSIGSKGFSKREQRILKAAIEKLLNGV